jgi:regulator of protease activity HflC (stomatin/prohibitin superfamily)
MRKSNLALLLVASTFGIACTKVGPNQVAVMTSCTGVMKDTTLSEGFHVTGLDEAYIVGLNSQFIDVNVPYASSETAVTRDRQALGFAFNISYQVTSGDAARALSYHVSRTYDESIARTLIRPVVDQAVKNVFALYNLEHILANRESIRVEVGREVSRILEERLLGIHESLGGAVEVIQVNLTNLDWAPELKNAIEQTQVVAQERRRATEQLEMRTIEFQQRVREAEAEGSAEITRATALARSREIEATSRRSYYETLSEAGIDPNQYAQMELFLSRWNGELPAFIGGGSGTAATGSTFSIPLPFPVGRPTTP